MGLAKWFHVHFISKGIMRDMHVYAHTEEEARNVALIQLRCTGRGGKLRIVDAIEEDIDNLDNKKLSCYNG